MNRHTGVTGTVAALLVSAGAWTYAQQSVPEQTPAFRSGVEAVSVEVGVVDKQGQPVRDLGPADFTVTGPAAHGGWSPPSSSMQVPVERCWRRRLTQMRSARTRVAVAVSGGW